MRVRCSYYPHRYVHTLCVCLCALQVTELERAPTVPTKLSPWSPWATQTATVAGQAVSKTSAKRAAGGEGCTEILGGLAVGVALALGVLAVFMSGLVK